MAFRHGVPTAPSWIVMIEAAAEFGQFPWAFNNGYKSLRWFMRWQAYRNAKNKIAKEQADAAKRKRNG